MKKFTILMIALLVASMSFAQEKNVSDVRRALKFQSSTKHTYNQVRGTRDGEQALVVFSAGDIWGDGTGYQLLIDADNEGWSDSYGPDCGSTYTQWEYMIPENAAAIDANAVCNATESLYIPAGTYSYLVLNPGCEDYSTNYIASSQGDPSNASDYNFEAGKMYTFTVELASNGNDKLTLTVTDIPSEPTLSTGTTTLSYITEINTNSNAEAVVINAMNCTAEVNATIDAPFQVSADNNTFGTTATLPAEGGIFYVRYAPTAVGMHNGTLTVSSTGATDLTVALSGTAYDCSGAIDPVWTEDFEPTSTTKYCWGIIDANADNNYYNLYEITEEGDHAMGIRYADQNDDYLVTPMLNIGANANITFGVADNSTSYPETYEVYAIVGDQQTIIREAAQTSTQMPEFETITVDLAAYAGQTIQIAIRNTSVNMYYFFVDNFTLNGVVAVDENIAETVAVYPNPTKDMVTVANAEGKNIVIVNSLGQVVANIENAAANQTIDVANFANGTYFVKVDAEVVKLNVVK